jgi:acetyl-CoA C-acetyltransferase
MSKPQFTPILVGVAQVEQRERDPLRAREPLALMIDAVRLASEDAGSRELLARASAVRVIRGMWPYKDPARAVAGQIGASAAKTGLTPFGGNFVQSALNRTALEIQSGALEIAILTGAECGYTQARARKLGAKPLWSEAPGTPDEMLGDDVPMWHPAERKAGVVQPVQMYPVFENALRHARGESIPHHIERVSKLWESFSRVATRNPHAWIREAKSAEAIRTPGPDNRMVSFPYPKLMNSNNNVDQGAALILTNTEVAQRLGIAREKWIYPWAGADAHDYYMVSERDDLHSSPAIRFAGRRALELAGVERSQLGPVDLYSCFPVAVQVAAAELGLSEARELTVTGGLTFGGGPLNNYVMHGVARLCEVLREQKRGQIGLCSANGGFLTKHSIVVYSNEEPARPFRHVEVQQQVDATPRREALVDYEGPAQIESYTVDYAGDVPAVGRVALRTPDGKRTWAASPDRDLAEAMTVDEFCGRSARVSAGTFSISN